MPRKFHFYAPKDATRKNSLSTAPAPTATPTSSSDKDSTNDSTSTKGTQCKLTESQLTSTQDEAVQKLLMLLQTDNLGELQDEVQPIQNDHICEANSDIKFRPLVIKQSSIFINSKGLPV